MRRLDPLAPRQIRNRPRQLQHAVIRPRAEVHLPHGRAERLAWRPVSSTGQWSRTWVGPMSALVARPAVGASFSLGLYVHSGDQRHAMAHQAPMLPQTPADFFTAHGSQHTTPPRRNREHLRNPGHPWLKTHRTLSWRSTSRICTSDVTQGSCGVR